MIQHASKIRWVILSCAMSVSACTIAPAKTPSAQTTEVSNSGPVLFSAPELIPIQFAAGSPLPGERLQDVLDDDEKNILRTNEKTLMSVYKNGFFFQVAGFADAAECDGIDCMALSRRRAALLAARLLEIGIPPAAIDLVEGYGTAFPLDEGATDLARSHNRRAEIIVSPTPSKKLLKNNEPGLGP